MLSNPHDHFIAPAGPRHTHDGIGFLSGACRQALACFPFAQAAHPKGGTAEEQSGTQPEGR